LAQTNNNDHALYISSIHTILESFVILPCEMPLKLYTVSTVMHIHIKVLTIGNWTAQISTNRGNLVYIQFQLFTVAFLMS